MTNRPEFTAESVTIICTDQRRAERFYGEVLGATPIPGGDGYGCSWFQLGAVRISLMPNAMKPVESPSVDRPGAMLWLEVSDLGEAHAFLVERGVTILSPPNGQFMLITDPDGVVIEVWQRDPS